MLDQNEERRRWTRLSVSFPLFAYGTDHGGQEFKILATALNVSNGGILLSITRKVSPTSTILLKMPVGQVSTMSAKTATRDVPAQVVRVEHRGHNKLLAVRFQRAMG